MSDHLSSSNCVLNRSWLRAITFTIMCVCASVCVKGWDTKSDRQRAICRTLTCDCKLSAEVASLLQSSSLPCCCPDVTAVSHHRDLWLLHLRRAFFFLHPVWSSCRPEIAAAVIPKGMSAHPAAHTALSVPLWTSQTQDGIWDHCSSSRTVLRSF